MNKITVRIPKGMFTKLRNIPGVSVNNKDRYMDIYIYVLFLSKLYSGYIKKFNSDNKFVSIHSTVMSASLGSRYRKIIGVLVDNNIIEVIESYNHSGLNNYTKKYRMINVGYTNKTSTITLKSCASVKAYEVWNSVMESRKIRSVIFKHQEKVMDLLIPPSVKGVKNKLLKMRDRGIQHKGKNIVFKNEAEEGDLVIEDVLQFFNYVWGKNREKPFLSNPTKKCSRVTTCFSTTSSFIRNMFKVVGGEGKLVDCDYVALHLNIALCRFYKCDEMVTHKKVADYLNMPIEDVKKYNLCLLNQPVRTGIKIGMDSNPVLKYFEDNHTEFINELVVVKNKKGYKYVSKFLFDIETAMAESILGLVDFPVFYVYDGFYCERKYIKCLKRIMDYIAVKYDVNTFGKIS